MSDYGAGSGSSAGDAELQEFLMAEKQKAQVNAQVSFRNTSHSPIVNFYVFECLS